jgi:hypothetical protein
MLAYVTISSMANDMICRASRLDELTTAVSLLGSTFTLLKRKYTFEACASKEAYAILYELFRVCIYTGNNNLANIKLLIKSNQPKNNVLQQVIRTINILVETDSHIIHVSKRSNC